jgi:transposase-like protein
MVPYVSYKERKAVAADLRAIYQAPTAAQGGINLEAVEAKWQERYPHTRNQSGAKSPPSKAFG